MGIFGWSYPPGAANDPNAPWNQTGDDPIDLTEVWGTLKGYGRKGYGLNGKDADLDTCGQNVVESAYWTEDDVIEITGRRYATIGIDPDWTDEQVDVAHEIVCGSGVPITDGDSEGWTASEQYTLTVPCAWTDDETDEQNIDRACRVAYDAIEADSEAFEKAVADLHEALKEVGA